MIRHGRQFAAIAAIAGLLITGCRDDDPDSSPDIAPATSSAITLPPTSTAPADSAEATTTAPPADTASDSTDAPATSAAPATTTAPTEPATEAWTVNVDDCADPGAATAPIVGEIKIGSAQPASVSPAAAAFSPVKAGMELYAAYANANNLVPDHTISFLIGDDQYDPAVTPNVVSGLIDQDVSFFAGIIGTANNAAVRETLNEECIPQLLNLTGAPEWGDIENYPWTTGALVPYDIETKIYAKKMQELGVKTVALFTVNTEFGRSYVNTFKEIAPEFGFEIVAEQTTEELEATPPKNQLTNIANSAPDAILAVPLGAQCGLFAKELVNAKAVAAGWNPLVFQTATCAGRLVIDVLSGGTADGFYTSANLIDSPDPKFAELPGVKAFTESYNAAGLTGDLATASTGWTVGEYVVAILNKAAESGALTRQSIIEAARNLEFVPSLGREGTVYKMNGQADPFTVQSATVLQWSQATKTFTEIGPQDTEFES